MERELVQCLWQRSRLRTRSIILVILIDVVCLIMLTHPLSCVEHATATLVPCLAHPLTDSDSLILCPQPQPNEHPRRSPCANTGHASSSSPPFPIPETVTCSSSILNLGLTNTLVEALVQMLETPLQVPPPIQEVGLCPLTFSVVDFVLPREHFWTLCP